MTTAISEIEAAYLATARGKTNPNIAPDCVDVPGLRRVVISSGEVMVNGEPASRADQELILAALREREGR